MNQPGMASIVCQLSILAPDVRRLANSALSTLQAVPACLCSHPAVEPADACDAVQHIRLSCDDLPDMGAGALAQLDLPRPFRRWIGIPRADRAARVVLRILRAAALRDDRRPDPGDDGGDAGRHGSSC